MDWSTLPAEVLLEIFTHLDAKALASAGAACRHWHYVSWEDPFWQRHFLQRFDPHLWRDRLEAFDSFRDEYSFFARHSHWREEQLIDDYGYTLKYCAFSPKGTYFAVIGAGAHFCVYQSDPVEFLHERSLESIGWKSANSCQFSPNESRLLIHGTKTVGGVGEIVVYSLDPADLSVHFVCRVLSNPAHFGGCWFNDDLLMTGEIFQFGANHSMITSMSQLWLSRVPTDRWNVTDSIVCPVLRFLNELGSVQHPLVSSAVSSRFRRVVQMTEQARAEGKSLSDVLHDLQVSADISVEGDLTELRDILDREKVCLECYLKHQLTEEEYGGKIECHCVCHEQLDRLLIYVCGEYNEKVCFKLVTQQILNDALSMRRFKQAEKEKEDEDDDAWSFIQRRVDQPDRVIEFRGQHVRRMALSHDQTQLYIVLERFTPGTDVSGPCCLRCVDLASLVDHSLLVGELRPSTHAVAANDKFVVSCSGDDAVVWSRHHQGLSLARINHKERVNGVAVHPHSNVLITISGMELRMWKGQ